MRDPVETRRQLRERTRAYDFYAALRLLECAHPKKPRIGTSLRPADDAVRFSQEASQAFSTSALRELSTSSTGVDRLVTNFFGLLGPNGPMPGHITEHIRDRSRNSNDHATARFFDLFHHRMMSLLYRAWATAQPAVSMDRPQSSEFANYIGTISGRGTPSFKGRDSVNDFAKLHFAGRLGSHTRNAEGLQQILQAQFNVPVRIRQFVGQWIALPESEQCRFQRGPNAPKLGVTTVIGRRIHDAQSKFRIVLGPLTLSEYKRFLPGSKQFEQLTDWVKNYVGESLDWDAQLLLKRQEVPNLTLDGTARLGHTSWVYSKEVKVHAQDLIVRPTTQEQGQR